MNCKRTFNDGSREIIKVYYEVYNHTVRNLPEYLYERVMVYELKQAGISVTQQDEYDIIYKGTLLGKQRLDLFVANELVVELKALAELTKRHKAQAISYIKTVNRQTGLLFNFGSAKPEFNRLYFNPDKQIGSSRPPRQPDPDWLYPELTYQIIAAMYEIHHILGAGFVYRMYARACFYELRWRKLTVEGFKKLPMLYKGRSFGQSSFAHLLIEGKVMLFPVAIESSENIALQPLRDYMQSRGVRLGVLVNFDTVRLTFLFIRGG